MPVTTRIIIPESGSRRKPHGIWKLPIVPFASASGIDEIHGARRTVCSRPSAGSPSSCQKTYSESSSAAAIVALATRPAVRLLK